jgi:hypothetical protein
MILVLRAISDTDVNLPVPRRMSKGLRTVGAEMTMLLVVEELLALGLLWWVEITVSLPPKTCPLVCGVFLTRGLIGHARMDPLRRGRPRRRLLSRAHILLDGPFDRHPTPGGALIA